MRRRWIEAGMGRRGKERPNSGLEKEEATAAGLLGTWLCRGSDPPAETFCFLFLFSLAWTLGIAHLRDLGVIKKIPPKFF